MKNMLSISYQSNLKREQAEAFAQQHQLNCVAFDQFDTDLLLNFADEFIELRDVNNKTSLHVDFISGSLAHRQQYGGGRGQAIAKAIGLKQGMQAPSVVDATAGLAKDSFVMACLGCTITMLERSPIISQLVFDAIQRAESNATFNNILQQGFELINIQATEYLNNMAEKDRPDVIYLDPMYPERKKTALVKKNMQILQNLLGHDSDTSELIELALQKVKKRVVVKRPKGADAIGNNKPTMIIESKKTRYDVYVISANKTAK